MKIRCDFVSNSSSSSYVIADYGKNTINRVIDLISKACSVGDGTSNMNQLRSIKKHNSSCLKKYLPKYTCVMIYGDEYPMGISNKVVEKYVKNGKFVVDEEIVWKWLNSYDIDSEIEKEKRIKRESFIAIYNENSLALSKLYFKHFPILSKEEYIEKLKKDWGTAKDCQKYLENSIKEADRQLQNQKDKREAFEKCINDNQIIVYCHINDNGDGMDKDKLYAEPYFNWEIVPALGCLDSDRW